MESSKALFCGGQTALELCNDRVGVFVIHAGGQQLVDLFLDGAHRLPCCHCLGVSVLDVAVSVRCAC